MIPQNKGSTTAVRQSKYRNVFGQPFQAVDCIKGVLFGSVNVESSPLAVNPTYSAAAWKSNGTIGVWKTDFKGTLDGEMPMISNDSKVNDLNFNPFHETQIASVHDDGMLNLWEFPEGGLTSEITTAKTSFQTSDKRAMNVEFHPLAEDVVVTADSAKLIKLWDLSTQQNKGTMPEMGGQVINWSWNKEGSQMAVLAKDKFLHLLDPRAASEIGKAADHQGAKSGRVIWLPSKDKIMTVGFGRGIPDRSWRLYDPRDLSKPIAENKIDQAAQSPILFYDDDNGLLFLTGKGNGTVNFYEVSDSAPYLYELSSYKAKESGSSYCALPKRCVDVRNTEVMRILQLTPSGQVVPIKFIVPRRENQFFQDDLYPDCHDGSPSMSASEWFGGSNTPAKTMSLKFD